MLNFLKRAAASVPAPDSTRVTVFVDSDGVAKTKNSGGAVSPLAAAAATPGLPAVLTVSSLADGLTVTNGSSVVQTVFGNPNYYFDANGLANYANFAIAAAAVQYSGGQFYMEPYNYSLTPNSDLKFASQDLTVGFSNSGFFGYGGGITVNTYSGSGVPLDYIFGAAIPDGAYSGSTITVQNGIITSIS